MRNRRTRLPIVLLALASVTLVLAGSSVGRAVSTARATLRSSLAPAPIISWENDQVRPAVAYSPDAGEYLVVWEDHHWGFGDDWDIYGRRVGSDGNPVSGSFGIAWEGENHRLAPDVTYSPAIGEYLVVWEHEYSPDDHDIYVRRVATDGTPGSDELPLAALSNFESNPAATYNFQDAEYFVVWERREGSGPAAHYDIYGRRLDLAGDPQGPPIPIATGLLDELAPAAAYDPANNQYLVVWHELTPPDAAQPAATTVADFDIWGQRVAANGSLTGEQIAISTWENDQLKPRVAFNSAANQFLVVWEDHHWGFGDDWDIYGQRVQANGTLAAGNFGISWEGANHRESPDVAYAPAADEYLVTWEYEADVDNHDVYRRRVGVDGALLDEEAPVSNLGSWEALPAVASDGGQAYLVVWEDGRNGETQALDIYGDLVNLNTLSGRVYVGDVGDESAPLGGVTVELYCSNNPEVLEVLVGSAITDFDGWFGLTTPSGCEYYNLVELDLPGYESVGATSVGGAVIDSNWIQYTYPLEGQALAENKFWDRPVVTSTPTLEATPTRTPTPTMEVMPTSTSTRTATSIAPPAATMTPTTTRTATRTATSAPPATRTATATPVPASTPRAASVFLPLILRAWPPPAVEEEVPAHEMPVLVAVALTPSEAYPAQGEQIDVEIQVENSGAVAAPDVPVVLYDGDQLLAARHIALSASDETALDVPWTADAVGVHSLTAVIDPDETLIELDRGDNSLSIDVVVASQPPPEADFAVIDLAVEGEPDQPGMLRAMVGNNGSVAGQTPLRLRVDGRVVAEELVGPVGPGQSVPVEVPWPTYLPIGQLTAEINPRYRVAELNPEDNLRTLDLRPVADLRVEGLSVAAPQVESGQPRQVTLSFRVENAGRQAITTPFRTRIFPGGVDPDGYLRPFDVTTNRLAPGEITYVAKTVVNIPDAFDIRIEADVDDVIAEADEDNNIATARYENPTPNVGRWISIGPRRMTDIKRLDYPWNDAVGLLGAIAIHPTSPGTIYVGSPRHSGVWKTTNGGSTWQSLSDSLPSLNVAALAIDPSKPSRVYLATAANGIFRSEDGGIQWTHVYTGNLEANTWGGRLLVDPNNSARLYLASKNGIRRSTDSGASWPFSLWGGRVPAVALVMDPSDSMTLYAAMYNKTNSNVVGIYRTVNGGDSWQKLEGCPGGRLPSASADTNISLGMSGSRLYAAYRSSASIEVWRTTDIGCSIGGRHEQLWEKGWTSAPNDIYGPLYVHNRDPNYVYLDGVSLRRSTDGGKSFEVVSGYNTPDNSPHADNHGFASDPLSPNVVYTLGDGGIYRSNERGKKGTWTSIGDGIANVEFYDHAVAATAPGLVIGGTQDNGSIKYDGTSTVWKMILGGDGSTVDIDPTNAQILYAMNQFADSITRSTNGGQSFDEKKVAKNLPGPKKCRDLHWQVHPSTPTTMLASCEGSLWRTTTTKPPADWKKIYTPPAGGIVRTTVDGSTDLYYAGTNQGRIYAGRGGAGWRNVFSHPASIGLTDIEVDRGDPATVYATFGCGNGTQHRGRVYRLRRTSTSPPAMTDQDITTDLRRDVCVKTLAVDRMHPDTVYVGTAKGVYRGRSADSGATWAWTPYSNGLPAAVHVVDLEVHPTTGVMRAATWGRSVYEVNTDFPIGSRLRVQGKVTLLRVHDVGTGFGPPTDRLDAEVVVRLDSQPDVGLGFQLRDDANAEVHRRMLDLLRDAFNRDRRVSIEYDRTGFRIGRIVRVIRVP